MLLSGAAAADCGHAFTPISQVQGAGAQSPLVGSQVTVEGVVTADFSGRDRLSGFYLMSTPADADDDSATSEGLFVHLTKKTGARGTPAEGQRVRLSGRVKEYHGLTELTAISALQDCGRSRQGPLRHSLVWPIDDPERLEGMRVAVGALSVLSQRELARYGALGVAPERLFIPTQVLPPGPEAGAIASRPARLLLLDDGSNKTFPQGHYGLDQAQAGRPLRLGDRVQPFTGIVDFRYGQWRLQPVGKIDLKPFNERPEPPAKPPGAVRLASYNLQNFFNGDGRGGGFPTPRGAETEVEYQFQKARLVKALSLLDADVIALAEVENDGFGADSAIADLARAMGADWAFVDFFRAGTGRDQITNGILYRPGRLTLTGAVQSLKSGAFAKGNRPALAAAFRRPGMEAPVVVVANHFKSKRCGKAARGDNADRGDGQGCWAALRTRAAAELVDWLATDPTRSAAAGALVMGDLNSYRQESPLDVLRIADFHDPAAANAYSYVFDGQLGTLDYTWVSGGLKPAVLGAGVWHGNVDERGSSAVPSSGPLQPWGVSDHDPVWVDLKVEAVAPEGRTHRD